MCAAKIKRWSSPTKTSFATIPPNPAHVFLNLKIDKLITKWTSNWLISRRTFNGFSNETCSNVFYLPSHAYKFQDNLVEHTQCLCNKKNEITLLNSKHSWKMFSEESNWSDFDTFFTKSLWMDVWSDSTFFFFKKFRIRWTINVGLSSFLTKL